MKLRCWNGLCRLVGAQLQYRSRSSDSFQALQLSPSQPVARVVSLGKYRAQRRAGRIAWNILVAAVVAIGMITTGAALHREQRLQMIESGR